MANRRDIQFHYSPHNKATVLDCSFVVDHTNGNGFGIRSLKKSGRISSVFMNTTATPGKADNGLTNPNPLAGQIIVTLQDNYNTYLGGYSGFACPTTGSPISISGGSVLSIGQIYIIASLGTTTQAQWVAAGLPSYITAAVGVSFMSTITGGGSGTGTVIAYGPSGIDHIEVIGDSNLMNSNGANLGGFGVGMTFNLACFKNTVLTAPNDGTVIGLNFYLNNSAQGV